MTEERAINWHPPRAITPAVADAVVERVRQGVPASAALRALGISQSSISNWLTRPIGEGWRGGRRNMSEETAAFMAQFRERIEQAEAEFETKMIEAINETGFTKNEKTGLREWRALAWTANNHPRLRSTYHQEKVTINEGEQTIRHEHRLVREISDKALKEYLEGE